MTSARQLDWLAVLVCVSASIAGGFGERTIAPYSTGFIGAGAGLLVGASIGLLMRHFGRLPSRDKGRAPASCYPQDDEGYRRSGASILKRRHSPQ